MKKLIIGLLAVGAAMALRPVVKRRVVQTMQQRCKQMMAQFAGRRETTGDERAGGDASEDARALRADGRATRGAQRAGRDRVTSVNP